MSEMQLFFEDFKKFIEEAVPVTPAMREAGASAIEDLEGVGSLEEKAEAAYKAMVAVAKWESSK